VLDRLVDQDVQGHLDQLHDRLAGFDHGQVVHPVHDALQRVQLPPDLAQHFLLLLAGDLLAAERIAQQADGRNGRAQLMGDVGHHIAAGAVEAQELGDILEGQGVVILPVQGEAGTAGAVGALADAELAFRAGGHLLGAFEQFL